MTRHEIMPHFNYIYGLDLGDGEGSIYKLPTFLTHLTRWMKEHPMTDWDTGKITYLRLLWTWSVFERAKKKGKQWGRLPSHQLRGKVGLAEVKCKTINTFKTALEMSLDDTGFDNDILAIISKRRSIKEITGELDCCRGKLLCSSQLPG